MSETFEGMKQEALSPLVCIAGKNRIACDALEMLRLRHSHLVVCPVDADVGEDHWQPSLVKRALELGVPIVTLNAVRHNPNLVLLSLEYDRVIRLDEFASSRLFNIHFSKLPEYKGCLTSIWPIYFGEKSSGVTLHRIDEGIDTGPIVDQMSFNIEQSFTARHLYEVYQDKGLELLKRNFDNLVLGREVAYPQFSEDSTYFSRQSLSAIDFEIKMPATANQIRNHVHCLFFPEFQTALFRGVPIKAAIVSHERSKDKPGTILDESPEWIKIATVDFNTTLWRHTPLS